MGLAIAYRLVVGHNRRRWLVQPRDRTKEKAEGQQMAATIGTKRKMRTFQLQVALDSPHAVKWVEEVIGNIERDRLMVYRPDDKHALDWKTDTTGDVFLETRATMPVSIKEWLPVGCQVIEWKNFDDQDTLGIYQNNAHEVLWPFSPFGNSIPQGPSAFAASIGLRHELLSGADEAWFKGLVAHELVHAYDLMRFLVPAFLDWNAFWRNVLHSGADSARRALVSQWGFRNQFVDSYGEGPELSELERYWPSNAKTWFKGFNAKWRETS